MDVRPLQLDEAAQATPSGARTPEEKLAWALANLRHNLELLESVDLPARYHAASQRAEAHATDDSAVLWTLASRLAGADAIAAVQLRNLVTALEAQPSREEIRRMLLSHTAQTNASWSAMAGQLLELVGQTRAAMVQDFRRLRRTQAAALALGGFGAGMAIACWLRVLFH